MERVRAIAGRGRLVLAAGLAVGTGAATGCGTTKQFQAVQHAVKEAVIPEKPAPATEFVCGWQTRLASLPDPTKGGAMNPGLVGQVFLYTAELKPAAVEGDLTITVNDTTARPAGAPAMRPEVYHFDRDTLRKMVISDERFGRCVAVFLPWPEGWRDVDHLYVQARYDQHGGNTLYAQPTSVTLDLSAPGGPNAPAAGVPAGPDPAAVLKQLQAQAQGRPVAPPGVGLMPGPVGTQPTYAAPMSPPVGLPGPSPGFGQALPGMVPQTPVMGQPGLVPGGMMPPRMQ